MSNCKKVLFSVTILFLLFILPVNCNRLIQKSFAETRVQDNLEVTGDFPVLSAQDNVWYPGKTVAKQYVIQNTGDSAQDFALKLINLQDLDALTSYLFIDINSGSTDYFGTRDILGNAAATESIQSLYDKSNINELVLFNLSPKSSKTLNFIFTMDQELSNSLENKKLGFDLIFGFSQSGQSPAPTPAPTVTGSQVQNNKSSGPTATPAPSSSGGVVPSTTPIPALGVLTQFGAAFTNAAGNILGISNSGEGSKSGEVLGAQKGKTVPSLTTPGCREPAWWILFLLLEAAISAELVFSLRWTASNRPLYAQICLTFFSLLFAGALACNLPAILASGTIGIAGVLLMVMRLKIKENQALADTSL
ncbi:hypothetical protein M1271_00345 [Patescibacteria group bacterium]|nr:hypothetical protein [Patescibacteria group bacterium]